MRIDDDDGGGGCCGEPEEELIRGEIATVIGGQVV